MQVSNVISAFSEDHVERLTGITKHKLRYWDRTKFFIPSFGSANRRVAYSRVYSFKDIASLRVLAQLIDFGVSLQHLREVSRALRGLSDDRWLATELYVLKRKVVFVDPTLGAPREIISGQWVMPIPLQVVWKDTASAVAKLREREPGRKGQLTRNRLVAHNAVVVSGTRVPVAAIKDFHAAGYSVDQIIAEYPDLTPDDVKAALNHHKKRAAA